MPLWGVSRNGFAGYRRLANGEGAGLPGAVDLRPPGILVCLCPFRRHDDKPAVDLETLPGQGRQRPRCRHVQVAGCFQPREGAVTVAVEPGKTPEHRCGEFRDRQYAFLLVVPLRSVSRRPNRRLIDVWSSALDIFPSRFESRRSNQPAEVAALRCRALSWIRSITLGGLLIDCASTSAAKPVIPASRSRPTTAAPIILSR